MPSVISQIAEWGTTLPYWEQMALERILANKPFDEHVHEELLQNLLAEAGLGIIKTERPEPRLTEYFCEEENPITGKPKLRQISNLKNINALAPNQKLEFGDKVTVIFGDNGSGKSGYARVIASAAFTRGDKDILRDIKKPYDDTASLSADIHLVVGDELRAPICHIVGQSCPEMSPFYVFDSTSVRAHLSKANALSFSPANLDILTGLAEVTDEVRNRLQSRIEQMRKLSIPLSVFEGESDVTKILKELSSQTDEDAIRALGTLTTEELQKISELDKQIAELKSTDFVELIASFRQKITDLEALIISIESVRESLDSSIRDDICHTVMLWQEQTAIASRLNIDIFQADGLEHIGSSVWYEFAKAALKLAVAESASDAYPGKDSVCLLCHQPLSPTSHDLLHDLWNVLQNETQKRLSELDQKLNLYRNNLSRIAFDFFQNEAVSYRILLPDHQPEISIIEDFLTSCRKYRRLLIDIIDNKQASNCAELPLDGIEELRTVISSLENKLHSLREKQNNVEIKVQELTSELRLLEHRKTLGAMLDTVLEYLGNEKWIRKASSGKVKGSTAHITKKYNAMFSELVTDKYIDLFARTLTDLKCPLDVDVIYKAEKGRTYKRLALKTNDNFPRDQANPDKVLSEGEQRAVALADFFTEIALDEHSSGFILDDPVTSLDFRWKETIAEMIIREAIDKQAIVFTHDLHFLHCLKTKADETSLDIRAHWIQKRENIPGYVFNDNSPMCERDYKDAKQAQEFYKKAKAPLIRADDQQYYLDAGFGALRTSYEAFIMFDLFNNVVSRFEERISGDRLKDVYIDEAVRDEVIESVGRISRYIGAHLHSDMHMAQKPTPETLNEELERFTQLRTRHRKLKKDHGIKG
jgi:ABC-type Na+ transport system ATPase subunit NatA